MAHLQPDEIAHYQREGWVVPRWQLPPERVRTMVHALAGPVEGRADTGLATVDEGLAVVRIIEALLAP
jgi:hypothetical protein